MELKIYLQMMVARWWIVLPTLLVTLLVAIALSVTQTPVYQAAATYVVALRVAPTDDRTLLSALGTLRNPEIAGTLVEVANSRLIRSEAANELGLTDEELSTLRVESRPVVSTNVIEIVAEGPDPALARDFAGAIGVRTAVYMRGLYPTYELQLIDEPTLPTSPVRPRTALNVLMGALVGLVLGGGLALLSQYLQTEESEGTRVGAPLGLMPLHAGQRPEVRRGLAQPGEGGIPTQTTASR